MKQQRHNSVDTAGAAHSVNAYRLPFWRRGDRLPRAKFRLVKPNGKVVIGTAILASCCNVNFAKPDFLGKPLLVHLFNDFARPPKKTGSLKVESELQSEGSLKIEMPPWSDLAGFVHHMHAYDGTNIIPSDCDILLGTSALVDLGIGLDSRMRESFPERHLRLCHDVLLERRHHDWICERRPSTSTPFMWDRKAPSPCVGGD